MIPATTEKICVENAANLAAISVCEVHEIGKGTLPKEYEAAIIDGHKRTEQYIRDKYPGIKLSKCTIGPVYLTLPKQSVI